MMYKIEDFYQILFEIKNVALSPEITSIFDEIQSNLSSHITTSLNGGNDTNHWERNKYSRNGGGHREKMNFSYHNKKGGGVKKPAPTEDWESLRNFKTTKVEEPVIGINKDINEIRISLNKISVNNYDIQKEAIVSKMIELQSQSPKKIAFTGQFNALDWEEEEESNPSSEIIVDDTNVRIVASAIFEIASSNKFFSELYAKLYKELAQMFPIFRKIASDFLEKYIESLPMISYVDPNIDYDGFCIYTKENDVKKATSTFIIHLMKNDILSITSVMTIVLQMYNVLIKYMNTPGKINEVEELAENWGIFITNGHNTKIKEEPEWNRIVLPAIKELSQMKPKENASLSNRVIFKWMNILDTLNK